MARIPLAIGSGLDADGVVELDASRFNRHTFWCGQSGSGKTYALGVLLEQLLLETALPLVVFDPNSDYVHLGRTHPEAPGHVGDHWSNLDVRVFAARDAENPLLARFIDMTLPARAAVLRLDPIADAAEYNVLRQLEDEAGPQDGSRLAESLGDPARPDRQQLLRRVLNLGVLDWDVWARGKAGVEDVIEQRPDATVLDLGGFYSQEEPRAAALAVLDRLWATRERREPVLLVVDEAHNLCPAEPRTPLARELVERFVQIAAEGRKFGLWLLMSTQRPDKLHPQVLSQCDNLCLMKTNGSADLDRLAAYFSAVPRDLLDRAQHFGLGHALFSGGIVTEPTLARMRQRWTPEGGSDVAVPVGPRGHG